MVDSFGQKNERRQHVSVEHGRGVCNINGEGSLAARTGLAQGVQCAAIYSVMGSTSDTTIPWVAAEGRGTNASP